MNKSELLTEIEWLLLCKNVGENKLYTFENQITLLLSTYSQALRQRRINFFSSIQKTIDHRYYEIFIGRGKIVFLSTHSYTIPAMELTRTELMLIYREMQKNCKDCKPIYS